MCGIAGIVGPDAAEHVAAVERMLASQSHRGPDGEGVFVAPSRQCVLGHRRLAILDLSDRAAQPMTTKDAAQAFVYNGEAYNYPDLRERLLREGSVLSSTGDAEVVFRLLATHGPDALTDINGMFGLALWDDRSQELLLARDRFGQKPVYFARARGLILFASELRALLASDLVSRQLNWAGLVGFLSLGSTQGPSSIVHDVRLLPAGSYLRARGAGLDVRAFWSPGSLSRTKRACAAGELRSAFFASVGRHLVSDVPIGVFLSGGIDSSAVAAASAAQSAGQVRSLCVVFPEHQQESEARFARNVAQRIGSHHQEIPVSGADMLRYVSRALDAMDQPTADGVNTFIVADAARQSGLKVVLSGLGADELFGGYPLFGDIPKLMALRALFDPFLTLIARLDGVAASRRQLAKLLDLLAAPNRITELYLARRKIFSSAQVHRLLPALSGPAWVSGQTEERLRSLDGIVAGRETPDAIGLLEMSVYMSETLLRDSDVMGMSHGLEIRTPFLDGEFTSLVLELDASVRRPTDRPKWCLTDALQKDIPTENVHRRKQGFALPFASWLRGPLARPVEEGLETLIASGLVDAAETRKLWRRFLDHPERVGWSRPWSLFVLGRYVAANRLV